MDERRKRILFEAKLRGMKEADELLGGFAEKYVSTMSEDDLEAFDALLAQQDRDILAWVLSKKPVPPELDSAVFRRLLDYKPYAD